MKNKRQLLLLTICLGCLTAYSTSLPVQTNAAIFCNEPDGIGQSFTMPETAWITGIQLKIKSFEHYDPVNCRIDLQNYSAEAISPETLRSSEVSSNDIPTNTAEWVYVQFDAPYRAIKDQQLAWTYNKSKIGNTIGLSEGNPYKDGARFWRYPDGSVGISAELDFAFMVEYSSQIPGYDSDGDGLPDSWELMYGLNPQSDLFGEHADMDGDGYTNGQELEADTHPFNADTDGDGLPDGWEGGYGLDPLQKDSDTDDDTDGSPALFEFTFGTSPIDSHDFFNFDTVVITQGVNEIIIKWSAPSEVDHYYLDYSDDLKQNGWTTSSTKIFNLSEITSTTIPLTTNMHRLYRVRAYRNPSYMGALPE